MQRRESTVNTSLRAAFQEQGACCLRGVFDSAWIELVRAGLQEAQTKPSHQARTWTAGEGRFFQDGFAWNRIDSLRRFVMESRAAQLIADLLGSSQVRIYMDHLLIREPSTDKATPWHHDTPYCFVDGQDFCTIWLPLDPVSRSEGLRLVSGSHRWGKLFLPVEFGSTQVYAADPNGKASHSVEAVPDIDAAPNDYEILSWDVEPGDCLVFYCNMLHSAPPHLKSDHGRRVYSTRWIGDDARYTRRTWSVPPLPIDVGLQPGDRFDGELFPRVV